MEPNVEKPWTEGEKLYLLAEILKEAGIPSAIFLGIITDTGVEPRWTEIPLPAGRSLRSCQLAFQTLRSGGLGPSPLRGLPPSHPSQPDLSPNPRKRPLPAKDTSTPGARALQPRPPAFSSVNGPNSSPFQASSPADDPNQPPKKKRGRPSKAELELRAAAAAAKGEVYPPPKPVKTTNTLQLPGKVYSGEDAGSGAPTANPFLSSPDASGASPGEPGSAAKKRRGRPTKEEAQAKRLLLEAAAVAASGEEPAARSAAKEGTPPRDPADGSSAVVTGEIESSGTLPHSADVPAKE